jgi:hypothetical protein
MRSPGVSGRLVSRQFMRDMWRIFDGRLGESTADAASRQLTRWQKTIDAALGPASGLTVIHDIAARGLFRLLGFELVRAGAQAGVSAGVLLSVASGRGTGPLPVVIGAWTDSLDALTRRAVHEAIARSARWAFCFNGHALRLVDADRPYARRVLDFDLTAIARTDVSRALWATARAAVFDRRPAARDTPLTAIVSASDAHAERVADSLQQGVRAALEALAHALRRTESRRRTPPDAIVEQSLTIVYRLLFLLFAEARALVPMWNPIYRDSYSVDGLRGSCDRPAEAVGLWEAIQAISRLAHAGCSTRDLRVTAFNSQLFSPERAPLVERARVDDETMARTLRALTDAPGQNGTTRIAYADLGVEQLGSIYERLLDVTPDLEVALWRPPRRPHPEASASSSSGALLRSRRPPSRTRLSVRRKESGTFYTPRSMAEFLVRETLAPLVRDRSVDEILSLRVLDPAMGSGAFLVAACRFLAEACGHAQARDGQSARPTHKGEGARLRRVVAQRCLYGVDLNPAAVQLARLSLWLATLAADAPLTFLDHHLCVGDSLVSASIDDLLRGWPASSRTRRRPDSREPSLFDVHAFTSAIHETLPFRDQLAGPDDSADVVRGKERTLSRSLNEGALSRWLALADLWCARWFWNGDPGPPPASAWPSLADRLLRGTSALPEQVTEPVLRQARTIAQARRFLHWSLRFPEVFHDADGQPLPDAGFDAIVGNPPWDMVRGDARDAAMRDEGRAASVALSSFVRDTRLYQCGREAHLNRYQLFTERALSLLRPGGRAGLVLPWGVASDIASAPLRRLLFERCDTETLVGFENSDGLFPIHRSVRFALVVTTTGRPTERTACRLGERTLDVLEGRRAISSAAGEPANVVLTPAWLRRVSGEGLETPWVRDVRDVALVDRLYARWPALGSIEGWGAAFGRELNATDDRALFEPPGPSHSTGAGVPVIDGKHLTPFAAHVERSARVVSGSRVSALTRRLPSISRHRLAYRDVASPTNRVTLIAAVLPPHVVSTHTVFCLKSPLDETSQHVLCALMNSLVANYLVRLRVTTHVTVALVSRLPMPKPVRGSAAFEALASGARELEQLARATAHDGRPLEAGALEPSAVWARMQALAARTCDVTRSELEHVLSTFPLVDADARGAVLSAFDRGV